MIYSFIKPEPKPLLNKFNKMCLSGLIIIVVTIIIFTLFVIFKKDFANLDSVENQKTSLEIQKEIQDIKEKILLNKEHIALVNDIRASNINLKKSIKNLFDLVPDNIVLKEVIMEQKSLLIKGITPTKEVYRNLLETPLKSIFETSRTNYLQMENGWYNFVSVNTIENSEGFNE